MIAFVPYKTTNTLSCRRIVCECENLDPSKDRGKCSDECGDDIQSFGSIEELFENEAMIVSRQILMGRRDKYMVSSHVYLQTI